MEKKIIVADIDTAFVKELRTYCNPSKVTVDYYTKGSEILTLMGIEDPLMVFLSLDLPDVNDFVVFDILKRCHDPSSPSIFILYSEGSENLLSSIRKLKFTADGYLKKPVGRSDITEIIKKHLPPDSYLIPSEMITMKDILNDDDILDLGTISDEPGPEEELLDEDIFAENISIENEEVSDAGTNTEIKKVFVDSIESIPDINEPPVFDDSPFEIEDKNDLESISTDFQMEMKLREEEFEKERQALMEEMGRAREKEARSDEEKKRLLRDIETSELKMRELDREREDFRKKLDTLSNDYEKRIEELHIKYRNKMKKFEDLLKKSLTEIKED